MTMHRCTRSWSTISSHSRRNRSRATARREVVARRHVLRDEQPEPVAPRVPARVLDLDVLAHEVEAQRLCRLDVGAKRVVARRRVDAVRPEALVEHAGDAQRLAVEKQAPATTFDPSRAVRRGRVGRPRAHPRSRRCPRCRSCACTRCRRCRAASLSAGRTRRRRDRRRRRRARARCRGSAFPRRTRSARSRPRARRARAPSSVTRACQSTAPKRSSVRSGHSSGTRNVRR